MTIKVDHHVLTADGTLAKVSYIDTRDGMCELYPLDAATLRIDGERLRLPLSELKRVPASKRPPIEGLPSERQRCEWCARPLRPMIDGYAADGKRAWSQGRIVRRVFSCWNAIEQVFCTNACAILFAGASYRGGFRRKR